MNFFTIGGGLLSCISTGLPALSTSYKNISTDFHNLSTAPTFSAQNPSHGSLYEETAAISLGFITLVSIKITFFYIWSSLSTSLHHLSTAQHSLSTAPPNKSKKPGTQPGSAIHYLFLRRDRRQHTFR
jgi:hypothetical protein